MIESPRNAYRTCPVCAFYASRRGRVLDPEFALQAFKRGVHVTVVIHEYLTGVHDRHLAGLSLSTRPRTPRFPRFGEDGHEVGATITVQRCCNGCGTSLGDATMDELDAAVDGRPLPDVTLECGCMAEGAAA